MIKFMFYKYKEVSRASFFYSRKIIFTGIVLVSYLIISNFVYANKDALVSRFNFSITETIQIKMELHKVLGREFDIKRCGKKNMWICSINGNTLFYGVLMDLPELYMKSLTLTVNDEIYKLNVANMYIMSPPKKENFKVLCENDKWCVVFAAFYDAGATYFVRWQIRDGVAKRTMILKMRSDIIWDEVINHILGVVRN